MIKRSTFSAKIEGGELSARETAELIASFSKIIEHSEIDSLKITTALEHVARVLRRIGDHPTSTIKLSSDYRARRHAMMSHEIGRYREISLEEVLKLIADERTTKAELASIAFDRFGMPKSRISRIRIEEAADLIKAAANHEKSLSFIEANAHSSGADRRS